MATDPEILRIQLMFESLSKVSGANSFPAINALSTILNQLIGNAKTGHKPADNNLIGTFATASIEMWHRSIHSFLISANLTQASPIWASVAGYYSSHYLMRAIAHLLGYYQLFTKKVVIQLNLAGSGYVCNLDKKLGEDREHKVYWKVVKNCQHFSSNPLFYENNDTQPPLGTTDWFSDGGHRNKANYSDNIGRFVKFTALNEQDLRIRITKLAGIELNYVPTPDVYNYPDIDNVQLIALHRIVMYRSFLDEVLSSKNRFWQTQRTPSFVPEYFDFQSINSDYFLGFHPS